MVSKVAIGFRKWWINRLADTSVLLAPLLGLYLLVTLGTNPKTYDASRETQKSKTNEVK